MDTELQIEFRNLKAVFQGLLYFLKKNFGKENGLSRGLHHVLSLGRGLDTNNQLLELRALHISSKESD